VREVGGGRPLIPHQIASGTRGLRRQVLMQLDRDCVSALNCRGAVGGIARLVAAVEADKPECERPAVGRAAATGAQLGRSSSRASCPTATRRWSSIPRLREACGFPSSTTCSSGPSRRSPTA
jgi:hypothetical protein